MLVKERLKKQNEKNSRLEIIKSWMSSFVVTVVVVVVAVVVIPKSPEASIDNLTVFSNEVAYQVSITDQDEAITKDTLKIVLENQMEYYESRLSLGLNSGIFEGLKENTTYKMYILGDKGFGNEKLITKSLVTKAISGATITSFEKLETEESYYLDYQVNYLVKDYLNEYQSVNISYGIITEEYEETPYYETIEITDYNSNIIINDIPNYNSKIHILINALVNGEAKVLYETYYFTPFNVNSSLYISTLLSNKAIVSFYPSFIVEDIVYKVLLKEGSKVLEQRVFDKTVELDHYGIELEFLDLKATREYTLILEANFTNPETLRKENLIVNTETFTTLPSYTVSYEIEEFIDYYFVRIELNDPNQNFELAYYEVTIEGEHYPIYIDLDSSSFEDIDETTKEASFEIQKPVEEIYTLSFGIRSSINYTINEVLYKQKIGE
ncbi:MAG: hypothetical protein PHT83_01285 [Bacilli bacterium]|nr:hypothetical protein [Bacilli bacterium]